MTEEALQQGTGRRKARVWVMAVIAVGALAIYGWRASQQDPDPTVAQRCADGDRAACDDLWSALDDPGPDRASEAIERLRELREFYEIDDANPYPLDSIDEQQRYRALLRQLEEAGVSIEVTSDAARVSRARGAVAVWRICRFPLHLTLPCPR